APVETRPPLLREVLIRRLGSESAATDFSNRALAGSRRLFALSVQYHELAKRYPPVAIELLSTEVRDQVAALAQRIERSIADELQAEDRMLMPLLNRHDVAERVEVSRDWQARANRVFTLASAHDRVLSISFAVNAGSAPQEQDPDAILRQLQS